MGSEFVCLFVVSFSNFTDAAKQSYIRTVSSVLI